jgi:hypothetical protein
LKPRGTFYILDSHPARRMLLPRPMDDADNPVDWGYFRRAEPLRVEERESYASPGGRVHTAYYWPHGLGEIVTALVSAGLRLEFLHEFPKTVENCCSYEEVEPGRYEPRLRHGVVIPSLFSIRAVSL